MMGTRRIILFSVAGSVFAMANSANAARNVLLIIADDVGAQEFASYSADLASTQSSTSTSAIIDSDSDGLPDGLEDNDGNGIADGAVSMPTVDSLSSAGIRFTQMWANPVCSPTRASIYTGLYPAHHGIGSPIGNSNMIWGLPTDLRTLAEILNDEGSVYAKGLFGKWHLGSDDGFLPTDRGWDYFAGSLGGVLNSYTNWNKVTIDENGTRTDSTEPDYATTVNTEDTLAWIQQQSGPWWATVAYNAAHTPIQTPPSFCVSSSTNATGATGTYHQMIECIDTHLEMLLDGLDTETLANTTIFFVGDNGTADDYSQVYGAKHGKASVYQGGVHVPFIIADGAALVGRTSSGTGAIVSVGRTSTSPTHVVDLFSTMADIMGSTTATGTDSVSLVNILSSTTATSTRTHAVSEKFTYTTSQINGLKQSLSADLSALSMSHLSSFSKSSRQGAVRSKRYKLVYANNAYGLFDLSTDTFEQTNLWCTGSNYSTIANGLLKQLRAVDLSYPYSKCQ